MSAIMMPIDQNRPPVAVKHCLDELTSLQAQWHEAVKNGAPVKTLKLLDEQIRALESKRHAEQH